MNKQTLLDYVDACELVRETERDIQRMRSQEYTYGGKVTGSNPDFPYEIRHYNVSGIVETRLDGERMEKELLLLKERKRSAERIKAEVEAWLPSIPSRMQRIVRYKFFDGLTWEGVAVRMEKRSTAASVRMEFNRFFEKNSSAGQ